MAAVTKATIQHKIDDWHKRIESLYAKIKDSLANFSGIRFQEDRSTIMHEELMKKFSIQPEKMKILDVFRDGDLIGSFKPIGLWVIGARGRIDLLTQRGALIIVDQSEVGKKSEWRVFTQKNRRQGEDFDTQTIHDIFRSL